MAVNPFLKENKKEREPIKIYPSEGFVDENDNPIPFVLKVLPSKEAENLKDECMEPVFDPVTHRKVGQELNQNEYQNKLLAKSITYPDLTNKETQKSWGVRDEYELLFEMLDCIERAHLITEFDKYFRPEERVTKEAEQETKNE